MRHLKIYEEFKPLKDFNIGYKFNQGMLGILIKHEEWKEMDMLLYYLQKDKDIKFRLLISNRILLMLFPDKEDVKKLEKDGYDSDITDHYVPIVDRSIGWFYQDIIDEDHWEEVIIEDENDIRELEEKMKLNAEANKYNL